MNPNANSWNPQGYPQGGGPPPQQYYPQQPMYPPQYPQYPQQPQPQPQQPQGYPQQYYQPYPPQQQPQPHPQQQQHYNAPYMQAQQPQQASHHHHHPQQYQQPQQQYRQPQQHQHQHQHQQHQQQQQQPRQQQPKQDDNWSDEDVTQGVQQMYVGDANSYGGRNVASSSAQQSQQQPKQQQQQSVDSDDDQPQAAPQQPQKKKKKRGRGGKKKKAQAQPPAVKEEVSKNTEADASAEQAIAVEEPTQDEEVVADIASEAASEETSEVASTTPVAEEEKEKEKETSSAAGGGSEEPKKKKKGRKKPKFDAHDNREHINLVLIGHVDAGKSTLSGQILLSTGQIDERTIAKYEKEAKERNRESWWIAYIMDEDEEEKAKGKTVECGRAHFETDKKRYTILDAPGHKNYVPNMISGASQADVAVLVVSARKGEFEAGFERGGQTREHSLLAFTLGITRVVVVINKMDQCNWSEERYTTITTEIRKFLAEVGFKDKYLDFLPVSGQSGQNVKSKVEKKACPWWKGGTMLEHLDQLKKIKRPTNKPLRAPVLDRYKGEKGLTAIGKLESGTLSVGDNVVIMPTGAQARVSWLSIDEVEVKNAKAGENILIAFDSNKSNVTNDTIFGGCVVCANEAPAPLVTKFLASVYLSELPSNSILTVGWTSMLHCHNLSVECEITAIPHKLHPKTRKRSRKPPPFLRAKDSAIVEITILGNPIAVEAFEDFPQLGRFTLRDKGRTVGIGKIDSLVAKK